MGRGKDKKIFLFLVSLVLFLCIFLLSLPPSLSLHPSLLHLSPFLLLPSLSSLLSSSSFLLLPSVSHLSPSSSVCLHFSFSPLISSLSLALLHLLFLSPCPLSFNTYLSIGSSVPNTVLRKEEAHSQRTWDEWPMGDQTLVAQRLCQQGTSGQALAWTRGPPATLSLSLISLSNIPSTTSCRSYLLNI